TQLENETRITEAILRELQSVSLPPADVANGYHALIELTVGSAAIDAPLAGESPAARRQRYRKWRAHYAALDPALTPASVAAAPSLYAGSADDRFVVALDLLLDGLAIRIP
ncbi:MAG TPA: TetR family transcriptional regulator, partial [Acidimicrobiaceae bacterium]|nr:TetR family transcriptional regulator [Acidimicrobiaceae bacterium]